MIAPKVAIIVWFSVFIGTATIIRYNYGPIYSEEWPWWQVAVLLAILTNLWGFFVGKVHPHQDEEAFGYLILAAVVQAFVVYPGLDELNMTSDANGVWTNFQLTILQIAGGASVRAAINRDQWELMKNARRLDPKNS
jgi:hypothetical protein